MKKFKLTTETKVNLLGITLFQIEAIIDFKSTKKGEKGGWIEKEDNVSGDAWVYGNAMVFGNARVYGDAFNYSPLQIQGKKNFVTECRKGFLKIGCIEFSLEEWKQRFKEIGNKNGYSESEIKEYELYINLAIELQKLR